jgi:hypothetical protein
MIVQGMITLSMIAQRGMSTRPVPQPIEDVTA